MSIPPHHHFSNKGSKQWFNFFVVDRVLTWEILVEGISFVKWGGKERLDTVSQ
jgi:hypothetical protein